ncbi:hypothetical protein QJQ45_025989, partial [Haematococcus lacustris]
PCVYRPSMDDLAHIPGLGGVSLAPVDPYQAAGLKRTAADAGFDSGSTFVCKDARLTDKIGQLDELVRAKLQAMYASGVIQEGDLDAQSIQELSDFEPTKGLKVLEQFAASDLSVVRNKCAFLGGVMTRLRRQDGPRQHPDVQHRLDTMFREKKIRPDDLDARCYEALNHLPHTTANVVLDRFAAKDLSEVRRMAAFFMAHLRAVDAELGSHGGSSLDSPPGYPDGGRSGFGKPLLSGMSPALSAAMQQGYGGIPGMQLHGPTPTPMHNSLTPAQSGRVHRGADQLLAGVRVNEFHNLSSAAQYVPAPVALKLQTLWDSGVKLVSMLDDRTWEDLADLPAPEGLAVIDEVAAAMEKPQGLRNVNAFFASQARPFLDKIRGFTRTGLPGAVPPRTGSREYDSGGTGAGGYRGGSSTRGGYGRDAAGGAGSSQGFDPGRRDARSRGASNPPPVGATRGISAIHTLPESLQSKVRAMLDAPHTLLNAGHFDDGVCALLNRLPEHSALDVVEEIKGNDLANVRNIPAYLMGICKRHRTAGPI